MSRQSRRSFFDSDNRRQAERVIGRYPKKKSALIPLLHLAQEQAGYITEDAMREIAGLVEVTPAEVLGTCSFYEMFKRHEVGRYVLNICTNLSCQLLGGEELLEHAERRLGVRAGSTTSDGMFTIEDAECIAACTEAPCLQVNYRFRSHVSTDDFNELIDQLAGGHLDDEIPHHGVLSRVRQVIPDERRAGVAPPEEIEGPPDWMPAEATDR